MNVKEYIASGIVESYVLGLLTEAEQREFELACRQYPEIADARTAFEQALEAELVQGAPEAPASSRQLVLDGIANGADDAAEEPTEENRTVRTLAPWKWVAAASLILMAVSAYWALKASSRYRGLELQTQELQQQLDRSAQEMDALKKEMDRPQSDFMMASIEGSSGVAASIYWDTASRDVYLLINNMPAPAAGKQYQLWALLPDEDAPPLNLGMVEIRQERLLYRMKNVRDAKAFAITLEPRGGSPAPTSSPMISTTPSRL